MRLPVPMGVKRLERGRFPWPSTAGGAVSISAAQLPARGDRLAQPGADLAPVAGGLSFGSSKGIPCAQRSLRGRWWSVSLRAVGAVTRAPGQRCHDVDKRR